MIISNTNIKAFLAIALIASFSFLSFNKADNLSKGEIAPEISMKSPKGKELSLSSLRGKYVLIDFWASWCGPCRKENPNLVQVYEKYNKATFKNGEGFEIFSISLDKNNKQWSKAITKDNLSWKYHVSDLKGWSNEAAKEYGVSFIPYNVLIDPEGKIIAKNLKGLNLHLKLDEFVTGF